MLNKTVYAPKQYFVLNIIFEKLGVVKMLLHIYHVQYLRNTQQLLIN